MLRLTLCFGLVAGAILATNAPAADPVKPARPAKTAQATKAAFERLKALAGDWRMAKANDAAERDKVRARYRVTAGGSAVVETIFPGEPMEMVTVYHRDGDALMLTHYCCCGNQPRMRAQPGKDKGELVFDFAGGSNLDPARDPHMHSCRMQFVDANHIRSAWQFYLKGKPAEIHTIDLVRKK